MVSRTFSSGSPVGLSHRRLPIAIAAASLMLGISAHAEEQSVLPTFKVKDSSLGDTTEKTGSYTTGKMKSAAGLGLSVRDTPQSVSVISQQQIQDQAAPTIGDALRYTTGVSVKSVDRGRNSLSARGFTIDNFQLDGVPFATGNIGMEEFNTAFYDRVEIVRGATGLTNGAGDPSATVNLVRKRADSRTFTGTIGVEAGSWEHRGITADLSAPLNSDGSVRSRVIAGYNDADSFMDYESTENNFFYAVVDADITDQTYLSIGASHDKKDRDGVYWGGLPYFFTDGTKTNWDRSDTTAPRWNEWDTKDTTAFATLQHTLASGWVLSADASYYKQEEYSNLLWVYGEPDRLTGEGLEAYPYLYETTPEQFQFSIAANGLFKAWGREHEATIRVLRSRQTSGWDNGGVPLSPVEPVGNFYQWDGNYPAPVWGVPEVGSDDEITQSAIYGAVRLQLSDAAKAIIGGRFSDWEKDIGAAVWNEFVSDEISHHEFTPYLGLIYDLNANVSAFASYSSIFKPQSAKDRNGDHLDPLEGDTYETGLKGEFLDGKLNATASIFAIRQDNYAAPDYGYFVPGTSDQASRPVSGVKSTGYEIEIAGAITSNWNINVGWANFSLEAPDEDVVAPEHPRRTLKVFTSYRLPSEWQRVSVGGGLKWQDNEPRRYENPLTELDERVGEDAYTLVDLMVAYEIDRHWKVQLNANNVFDKKYKESSWGTFTYGEPRNILASAEYRF